MKAVGLELAGFCVVLSFAISFIPYVGACPGVIFPALLALAQFETAAPFLVLTALLAAILFTGGSIIEPGLMASGLDLSPLVVLLSLGFRSVPLGIVGTFLAVPWWSS